MINEDSGEVSGTTEDNISEPRQVGQESGISPWLCVCGWRGRKREGCILGEKKEKKRKASPLLLMGHKSSGWVSLFYSLPFAVPTHSCATAKSQNKYAFLGVLCQWVCEKQKEWGSFTTAICTCVCACVHVCNPGLCENVITCMSKRALVYVSKMVPVLSKNGLPADT